MDKEWTGRVPKPAAVLMLQIVGIICVVLGAFALTLGAINGFDEMAQIWAYVAAVPLIVAPFALLSGWSRPPGLVAGVVALAMMLVLVPVGTLVAAVIGFFGIKNKEHVRDYYAQGK